MFKFVFLILFAGIFNFNVFAYNVGENKNKQINIVSSIPAIHSVVLNLTEGVNGINENLIIKGNVSPHDYMLSPYDMSILGGADVVFAVSPNLETFLNKPLKNKSSSQSWFLIEDYVDLLDIREGANWEDHHGHGHNSKHHHHHEHNQNDNKRKDYHIWLSPVNAKKIAEVVLGSLVKIDGKNADLYMKNYNEFIDKLDHKYKEISLKFAKGDKTSFIVFHDAFQYFEKDFGLSGAGSFSGAMNMTSPKRYNEIKKRIDTENIKCIVYEPQSSFKKTISDDLGIKTVNIDISGIKMNKDKDFYLKLLDVVANGFEKCIYD